MSIKIALLKSNEEVISDVKEVLSDDNLVSYHFDKPYVVKIISETKTGTYKLSYTPWIVLSNEKNFFVNPDWVVTLYDPEPEVEKSYMEHVNG